MEMAADDEQWETCAWRKKGGALTRPPARLMKLQTVLEARQGKISS
jgi:hypothetical protein